MSFKILKEFLLLRGGVKFLMLQILAISFFKIINMKQAWFIQEWGTSDNRSISTFLTTILYLAIGEA